MRIRHSLQQKIFSLEEIEKQVKRWRLSSKKIAFTNGVFDILHRGHIDSLTEAASFADLLVVGVNSDASVKRLKGEERPVNTDSSRTFLLASLIMVDAVVAFEEDTPLNLIKAIMPDVLIKGGDYTLDQIVGAKEVLANGGEVKIVPITQGFSTTAIINKMKS
jgi:D-glycero-beta-D-manno-heptose 1-phosphate adenylyltransferase